MPTTSESVPVLPWPAQLALSAHPNPASGDATLSIDGAAGALVSTTVSDLLGRVIRSGETPSSSFLLEVGDLPPGTYLIRGSAGVAVATNLFVVAR